MLKDKERKYMRPHDSHKLTSFDRLVEELARLERNQERRVGREKAKGTYQPNNGPDSPSTGKPVGTQRKCKRCGQVGHISTNKKCA